MAKTRLSVWMDRVRGHEDTFVLGGRGKSVAPFDGKVYNGYIYLKNEEIEPLIWRLRKLKEKIRNGSR